MCATNRSLSREAGIEVTLIHWALVPGRALVQDMHATFQRAMIRDQIADYPESERRAIRAPHTCRSEPGHHRPCYTTGRGAAEQPRPHLAQAP